MAHLHPDTPRRLLSAGDHVEAEVVRLLAQGLPDAYHLFHGVDWSAGAGDQERHGECDLVVVNQAGESLLIEVKAGAVEQVDQRFVKRYGGTVKDVTRQVQVQFGVLRQRLAKAGLPGPPRSLLVMPQVRVGSETAGWPRERIVDAGDMPLLCTRVREALGPGMPAAHTLERVRDFYSDIFQVEPDVSAVAQRFEAVSTRLASGLATWVPRIHAPSGVIRVVATAGSGKTQLALRLLREAASAGRRAGYVCFNRALADHMARLLPPSVEAQTFHERGLRLLRRAGRDVDFATPGAFEQIVRASLDDPAGGASGLDLLVIDELQDLQPEWVGALLRGLQHDARAVLLEDPDQCLYDDREPFDIPEAVVVHSRENFRSPRSLVQTLSLLGLASEPIQAMSPLEGDLPDPIVATDGHWEQATAQAVQRCLQRGFRLQDIALVTLRGRERSQLLQLDRLGEHALLRFTGRHDAAGAPVWTRGDLLADSVRRFKGQAMPAVVLTECEFDTLDERSRRALFVGLTRARAHLEWVVGPGAAGWMGRVLAAADGPAVERRSTGFPP